MSFIPSDYRRVWSKFASEVRRTNELIHIGFFVGVEISMNFIYNRLWFCFSANSKGYDMWHTPLGTMVLAGPFAVLMAKGILYIVEDVSNCLEYDDDDCMVDYGYPAFDTLTTEQKAWVLHRIALGLFDPDTEPVDRAAYSDAAIDAAYRHFEVNLQTEWEDGKLGDARTLQHLVLECVEQEQRHQPEDEKRPPIALECNDWDQWEEALDDLRMLILQDKDHTDLKWQDASLKRRAKGKKILGIDEDYFTMIPDDPSKKEAMRLLKEAERICSDMIDRYE